MNAGETLITAGTDTDAAVIERGDYLGEVTLPSHPGHATPSVHAMRHRK